MNFQQETVSAARINAMAFTVYRAPIETPVQTSFGVMHDRPAVIVRIEDEDGCAGWGEIWCNFPTVGAEYRARLAETVLKPHLINTWVSHPSEVIASLTQKTRVLAVQTGEPGPLSQAIAGIDVALWDLFARRAGLPLWQYLGGASPTVPVYASGLNPTRPAQLAAEKLQEGYRAFKLKVGFGQETDLANIRALRDLLGESVPLMVDANQAWSVQEAMRMSHALAEYAPLWLEEPLLADQPTGDWLDLARQCPIPLAGGENIRGLDVFEEAVSVGALSVIQPDIGKWGGYTGCLEVARLSRQYGRMFCPHWLGGGVGLMASLHLKAAVGGEGYVEVDANPNPLREWLGHPYPHIVDGAMTLGTLPGLGVTPDKEALAEFQTYP